MKFTNRSPTDSLETRLNWAYYHRCILAELHKTHPPTHEAVVKFDRQVKVATLKQFQKGVRERLAYWSKKNGQEFAVFFTIEIERNNCVHYHFLIRTNTKFPRIKLERIVAQASHGMASLQHCEAVDIVAAITRYVVKDIAAVQSGQKEVLLFRKGLRLRQCGFFNHYFVIPKKALWEKYKRSCKWSYSKSTCVTE